jgi:anti-sigma B factor antagonist
MEPPSESTRSTKLRLDTTRRADGTVCLTVDGDVDMTTSDYFRQTVIGLVRDPAVTGVILDAADLSFIDSNGVTVLVKAHRAAGERGISFGVANTRDAIRGLLEMLGVYEMLTCAVQARRPG